MSGDDLFEEEMDASLEKAEWEESLMTQDAIILRDTINKELSKRGFHLRLSYLKYSHDEMNWNYVEPMHEWAMELQEVYPLVTEMVKEARRGG